MGSHQLDQQFAMTRLRAIETGRWVAVASPNGISGIIAPDGTVAQQAAQRTTDVMLQQVTLVSGTPPAVRLGAWPAYLASLIAILALLVGALSYRRARRDAADTDRPPPASGPRRQRVSEPA